MDAKTAQLPPDSDIDGLIAAVLRGEGAEWPEAWRHHGAQPAFVERALYHGVAGLLVEAGAALAHWPEAVIAPLMQQARAQTMWELRHRLVLTELLTAFADHSVPAIVLKGSAIAYDLHERPACRARCDTDLLVETSRLGEARGILRGLGFVRNPATASADDANQLQEIWHLECPDGTAHTIDLHWQAMNSPALADVLSTADCMAFPRGLPRLCEAARTMDRATMLVHVSLHRAINNTASSATGEPSGHDGERLIWVDDIHRLAAALDNGEWIRFCDLARTKGIARVCLDALNLARRQLAAEVPEWVVGALEQASGWQPATAYLLKSGRLARNWRDFLATRGLRPKVSYLAFRIVPSGALMRMKYPGWGNRPLAWLYVRRIADVLRGRRGRSSP